MFLVLLYNLFMSLFGYLIIFVICVFVVLIMKKFLGSHKTSDSDVTLYDGIVEEDSAELENEKYEEINFEEKFYERCQAGEKSQLFLNINSQQDCAVIQSLLYAADIPSRTDSNILNKLYGGVAGVTTSVFDIRFYILVNDYDEALEIVNDFFKQKIDSFSEKDSGAKEKILSVFSVLTAPYPLSKSQEIFGFTVYPKETAD